MVLEQNFKYYREATLLESISKGFTPRFLYKYVSIETAKIILENSSLKFSAPSEFNDPFDCKANISSINSYQDIFFLLYKMYHDKMSLRDLYLKSIEIYKDPAKREYVCVSSLEEVINKSGICCFSQTNNQILMWSHYANKHTGVCLKFDLCQDLEYFCPIGTVRYESKFLEYNYTINPETVIEHVCRKAKDWEYEKEVRVFRSNKAGCYPFNANALVCIIFGCRSDDSDIKSIKSLVSKKKYPNVSYQKAVVKQGEYALDIIDTSY